MKNVRNRCPITDKHILELIKECENTVRELGYHLPTNIKFLECKANRRAGLACYRDSTIVLSNFIFKEKDEAIKAVILHEFGHLIAGPYAHHGPLWKKVVNKISSATGISITRCYSTKDLPVHTEELQNKWKYHFRCKGCGLTVHYYRRTEFVKTYDQLYNGKPRWYCRHCGQGFELIKQ